MAQTTFQKLKSLEQQADRLEKEQTKINDCMELHKQILSIKRNYYGQNNKQYHRTSYKLCQLNNLAAMILLQKQSFDFCHVLLKKAETYALNSNYHKAVTFNNMACYFRRVNKYRLALTYLQNALALEIKLDHPVSIADTHLNLCAVLSHLGKHSQALEHILTSIVLLQDQMLKSGKQNSQRISVLAIAYHNMGVELEYLKRFDESINAYKKAVGFGKDNMSPQDKLVKNLENILGNAEETVKTFQIKKKSKKIVVEEHKYEKLRSVYGEKQRPKTANYWSAKTKASTYKQ